MSSPDETEADDALQAERQLLRDKIKGKRDPMTGNLLTYRSGVFAAWESGCEVVMSVSSWSIYQTDIKEMYGGEPQILLESDVLYGDRERSKNRIRPPQSSTDQLSGSEYYRVDLIKQPREWLGLFPRR